MTTAAIAPAFILVVPQLGENIGAAGSRANVLALSLIHISEPTRPY